MFFPTYQKCLLLISGSLLKTVHNITSCWPCQCYFWLYIFSLPPASPTFWHFPLPCCRLGSTASISSAEWILPALKVLVEPCEYMVSPRMRLLPRLLGGLGPASQSAGPVLTSLKNGDPPSKWFAKPPHALSAVLEVSFHLWLNIECLCIHGNCWNIFILDHLNAWGM